MSAKPAIDREWAITRNTLALGRSGFDVEECDAILVWLHAAQPGGGHPNRVACAACAGRGRVTPAPPQGVLAAFLDRFDLDSLSEEDHLLAQGVCLACRGRGFHT